MWHVYGRREIHIGFWLGILKERDQLEDLGLAGRIILKCILNQQNGRVSTGFIWLRIRTILGVL
jgi:hypothetical protein